MEAFHIDYHYPEIPKPLVALLGFVEHLNYCMLAIAFYLGLNPSFDTTDFYFPRGGRVDRITPTVIKQRLRVVEYVSRRDGEPAKCAVCLCDVEGGDEVRELGNCRHVFHRGCIDGWVDRDKLTCPVCRSVLLPAEKRKDWRSALLSFIKKIW